METLGQKLRAAREKKRLTLSKAAAATRIKIQNLEMMEADDFSKMPAPTYAKGFIRIYANFLGLDPAPLVQEYVDVHLNGPAEKPAPAPVNHDAPASESPSAANTAPPRTPSDIGAKLKQIGGSLLQALQPHLKKIGIAMGIVVVVMLVSRCVSNLGDAEDESLGGKMRSDAIAREPAEQYAELPVEGAKP